MRFIQTHSMGSDCTAPYDIVDYQAKTAVEFINEMLQQRKNEWGDIEVWADNKPLDYKRIKGDAEKESTYATRYAVCEGCALGVGVADDGAHGGRL